LALDEEEAKRLAVATQRVARWYNFGMSEKAMDHANLIQIMCGIYGTRLAAMWFKDQREKKAAAKAAEEATRNGGATIIPHMVHRG